MKRKTLFLGSMSVLVAGTLCARTWTSADGSSKFEGDLRDYNPTTGVVKVVRDGKLISFPETVLSTEDRAFLKENGSIPMSSAESAGEVTLSGEVGEKVAKAKLHRLDGRRMRRAEMDKSPEYYILYFSASW